MSVGLIVDTSAWIDFFAGRPVPLLEDALSLGTVVLPDRAALVDLLEDLAIHETPREHWVRVGELRRRMIAAGHAVSTPDAHMAQCALDRDAPLLSRDRAFVRVARHAPLRLATSV